MQVVENGYIQILYYEKATLQKGYTPKRLLQNGYTQKRLQSKKATPQKGYTPKRLVLSKGYLFFSLSCHIICSEKLNIYDFSLIKGYIYVHSSKQATFPMKLQLSILNYFNHQPLFHFIIKAYQTLIRTISEMATHLF